ncbi:MAG: PIN domain-containing protein [Pseudanabaena sp. CAN_BIN31]|nr:PIN domain-containing protein [Pseudanabaena sp. CAN_BIN31]
MKVLFDTNIIVAASIEAHPNHSVSLPWIQQVRSQKITGYISTHSIAEIYAVMTRLPLVKPLSPQQTYSRLRTNPPLDFL